MGMCIQSIQRYKYFEALVNRTLGSIACFQQTKQINERLVILYYDWFLHLDSAKI